MDSNQSRPREYHQKVTLPRKPGAFYEPSSPILQFRALDLILRVSSSIVCLVIIILGGICAAKGGVILLGILGPPAAVTILWSILQFALTSSRVEYMNFRSRFRMVIGLLITIGFAIAVLCCGLFKQWWSSLDSQLSYSSDFDTSGANNRLVVNLTLAGLVLGCVATLSLHRKAAV
ncbi:hypothetical protein AAL_06425 [Moelleriella libera RCEF 2490]|uniref:Uncharacterized protein n=1 Tax=Moelleriella libera RCEF 2490 TaxID=1081109 RepID=A0A167Z5Z0_9HYPO|nr:hypothetical protein AAL_06425 [Moelleriella libera RCEF 2490]